MVDSKLFPASVSDSMSFFSRYLAGCSMDLSSAMQPFQHSSQAGCSHQADEGFTGCSIPHRVLESHFGNCLVVHFLCMGRVPARAGKWNPFPSHSCVWSCLDVNQSMLSCWDLSFSFSSSDCKLMILINCFSFPRN